jgi:hypothetical protein
MNNSLPQPGSHFISLTRAIEMTALYRSQKENILAPSFQNRKILPVCETFNRVDIDTIMEKDGCEALRVYPGMDENLKVRFILVPVNEDNEDILPAQQQNVSDDPGDDIVEEGHRCPDICPPGSPLNS